MAAVDAVGAGVSGLMIFGIPALKDERGSAADKPTGIVTQVLGDLSAEFGNDTVLITDLCLCEYTSHGHCGILNANGEVDNDETLQRYATIAAARAAAGAHMVAPSGMVDGQVGVIRAALDGAGYGDVGICSYSAKYASTFYGPFREAAQSSPSFGDRNSYQLSPSNLREAIREVSLDIGEGADIVMIKPALAYLDIIYRVSTEVSIPVAAYQVSGEYAMVEAAVAKYGFDRKRVITEILTSIRRAGASIILTYWATEAVSFLK